MTGMLDRFHELGPELEIEVHYSVGYGWYGWARVYAGQDVKAEFDAELEGTDDTDDFGAFMDELYKRLERKVSKNAPAMVAGANQTLKGCKPCTGRY